MTHKYRTGSQPSVGPSPPQATWLCDNSPLAQVEEISHHTLQDLLGSHHPIELLRHVVAYEVLALLHRQLLPLPKGVNVGVVKDICASSKTSGCYDGSHGKAGLPLSVLLSALPRLFLKSQVAFISQLPPKKRLPAAFSSFLVSSSAKRTWEKTQKLGGHFQSITSAPSFRYFQICCIYCQTMLRCCTGTCNREHMYGSWSLVPKGGGEECICMHTHKTTALNWTANVLHKIQISVNWPQSGWSKVYAALTQRINWVCSSSGL